MVTPSYIAELSFLWQSQSVKMETKADIHNYQLLNS